MRDSTQLSELIGFRRKIMDPRLTPGERYYYYSMPAFDEGKQPILTQGSQIDSAKFLVEVGDLLISKLNPRIKRVWRINNDASLRAICSTEFVDIVPIRPGVRDFIYHLLYSDAVYRELQRTAEGTTNSHVRFRPAFFQKLSFWHMPPEASWARIAEILTTIDDAIAHTEALIAKTQQIKAGLMHDLFTRGVTPDGQLRPSRDEAPKLYKESPLGWIPREWDCQTIEELLASTTYPMRSGPFGSALLKEELVEDGIPLLGIDNVFAEQFVADYRRFVSHRKFAELGRYSVFPDDVIITIMGTVGRCCVAPNDIGRALSSKHLWTMTFDQRKVLPALVCWQLNYASWVKRWFAQQSQGAIMEAIQSSTLRALRLPIPTLNEQVQLNDRYRACSLRLADDQVHLEKLRLQKAGLMHDLLSGRVRVPEVTTQVAP